jgi:glycosyltransferase involved in cell wall biosynthesis
MPDVCLVLEGTWPYLTGGVAAWVDDLLDGVGDLDVAVLHLRDGDVPPPSPVYDVAGCTELMVRAVDRDPTETAAALPVAAVYHALSTGPASDVAAAAARRHRARLVVTEHGLAWREAMLGVGEITCGRVPPAERRPWVTSLRDAATRAYAAADSVTTVCAHNAAEQVRLGAVDPLVVPNAAPAVGPTRSGPARPPTIGFVGRVVPIKDVATFVRAAAHASRRLPGARFVVAGPLDHDAAYADEVRRAGAGVVELLGEVDGPATVAGLDVLVLPSISEAQPLVVLEAMAAGTPVVATAVGGVPELLEGRGALVRPGDSAGIAEAVVRYCTDEGAWRAASIAGQDHVGRHHRRDDVIAAYRGLYERLA